MIWCVSFGACQRSWESDVRRLERDQPIADQIAGTGERHYRLELEAGQAVRILVDQGDVDLVVHVKAPGASVPDDVDVRDHGVESITVAATMIGEFDIAISARVPQTGVTRYVIRLGGGATAASDADRRRVEAEREATQAKAWIQDAREITKPSTLVQLSRLLSLWRELKDQEGEASTLAMIGDALHAEGKLEEAESAYLEALTISREVSDRRLVAELLNNLGVLDWRRGRLGEASARYTEALVEWRALPYRPGEASTLTNVGTLSFESAAYQRALDAFNEAVALFEAEHDSRGLAYALNNIGVTRLALGDLDEALGALTRAAPAFRDVGDVPAEGRAHLRLARIHLLRGNTQLATTEISMAQTLISQAGDRLGEADAVDLGGLVAAASGDPRAALNHHLDARARYQKIDSRKGEATALHHAGSALISVGDAAGAIESLSRALEIRQQVGLPDAEAETLHQMAVAERQAGRVASARLRLRAALEITESVRGRVAGEYSRRSYFSTRQSYYSDYIDLLMQLDRRDSGGAYAVEAFAVAERQRARSLIDALEESTTDIRLGVAPAVLAREEELRREMNLWSYRLGVFSDQPGGAEAAAEARKLLADRVAEYRRVEAQIRATSRGYATLVNSTPLTVAELRRHVLDPHTALLRFSLGTPRSYLWLVTRESMRTATLPDRSTIDRAARRVHELVGSPPASETGDDLQLEEAARALSTMLLAPLGSSPSAHRLLIVAEGSLQLVPFVMLPEPRGESPLIKRHEIVTLPSATTLAVLRRQVSSRPPAKQALAVVADPVYDPGDPRIRRRTTAGESATAARFGPGAVERGGFSLERLRFSWREATSIAGLVPSSSVRMATGFSASRDTVMSAAMSDYRILHLAVHALLDDDHPEVSGIALSLFDETGRAQDGFLRLHEIHERLALRSDLVVVSACETALGRDVPGEGVMGLARAFFAAGAARVVASVYSVSDAATAQLMREFYRGMFAAEPLTPAAALRAAQLRMLAEPRWRHPFFWSGFVLLGEPR